MDNILAVLGTDLQIDTSYHLIEEKPLRYEFSSKSQRSVTAVNRLLPLITEITYHTGVGKGNKAGHGGNSAGGGDSIRGVGNRNTLRHACFPMYTFFFMYTPVSFLLAS